MEVKYSQTALLDIDYWKNNSQTKIKQKIQELIQSIEQSPKIGIGKPEPLKGNLSGCWSRRINKEHRIIYEFTETTIYIHSLRGHYN